jgi:hypothetical protein
MVRPFLLTKSRPSPALVVAFAALLVALVALIAIAAVALGAIDGPASTARARSSVLTPVGRVAADGASQAVPASVKGTFSGSWTRGGVVWSWTGSVELRPSSTKPGPTGLVSYGADAGSLAWSVSGTNSLGCTISGGGVDPIGSPRLGGTIEINVRSKTYTAVVEGWPYEGTHLTCPGTPPGTSTGAPTKGVWLVTGVGVHYSNDRMVGSVTEPWPIGHGGEGTITYKWNFTTKMLLAVAHGPSSVVRGDQAALDGSRSISTQGKIVSYKWTFAPSDCPKNVSPNKVTKSGERTSVVMLCSMIVKLTVSNGQQTDSNPTIVRVEPRKWSTPVNQKPDSFTDPGFNPDPPRIYEVFIGGQFTSVIDEFLGLNVSACDGAEKDQTARRGPEDVICPLRSDGSWSGTGGFSVERVHDPNGPFDGFYYVRSASFTIVRQGLLNHWLQHNSPVDQGAGENFYTYNAGHGTDLSGYLTALKQHEGMGRPGVPHSGHTLAMKEALAQTGSHGEPLDPRALVERQFGPHQAELISTIDTALKTDQNSLFNASSDPLADLWHGPVWVWSPKNGGYNDWKQVPDVIGTHD